MLDSNIRGLFKKIEYQIANLKAMFSKNEKQLLDNLNAFKDENEKFKEYENYKLDKHLLDEENPHKVTKEQVGLGMVDNVKQASYQDLVSHSDDTKLHVTEAKQSSWDSKETPAGSQTKANKALTDAKTYTDELAGRAQLNKVTADDGKAYERINANDPSILEKLLHTPGVHSWYIHEAHSDLPVYSSMRALSVFSENNYGWIFGANNRGEAYINRSTFNLDGQQEWSGWKRFLTDKDVSTWSTVTLINGTVKHNSTSPLRYSIRNNILYLRGSFEDIPANGTVIARFVQKPVAKTPFVASTVGSFGTAFMAVSEDGSLSFEGLSANDSSKVTRIELNAAIPLW
ncbi:hypothetical protein [Bacillus aerius]|uniref:hypothetical protein n=1 Tax=Bacillus aerius TaxID=293388 RepID=UPI00344C3FC3